MNPYLFFDLAVLAFISALVRRKVGRGIIPSSDIATIEQQPACNWESSSSESDPTTLECNATSVNESWKNQSEAATSQKQSAGAAANQLQTHAIGVVSSNVRRYEPLEFGTPAMCDNGDGSSHSPQKPFPCMILSYSYSSEEVQGEPYFGSHDERHSYHVYGIDGYKSYHRLPASRIAPVRDSVSAKSRKFKALYASFDPTVRYPTSSSSQRQQHLHGVVEVKEGRRRHPPYVVVGHGDGGYLLKSALAPDVRARSSRIRPYHVYEKGTPSMCNIGTWDDPHPVRCTILDHYFVDHGHGRLWYKVSYRTEGEGVEKEDEMSFANVQRIDSNVVIV